MYKLYYDTDLGILEIKCCDTFLKGIKIVDSAGDDNPNSICFDVREQLTKYFNREIINFNLPIEFGDDFKSRVYKALYNNNYGNIVSYKQLGEKVGTKAFRAVGSAMATNPYFVVVP